jgi:nicotinamide riboside kinase
MIISFTGAQSSGKSTLLQMCKASDYFNGWKFVPEVTRKIKDSGYPINEAGTDETQQLILAEHIKNHIQPINSVLDRCILDGYVYTKYLYTQNKIDKETYKHAQFLLKQLLPRVEFIFYTDPNIPLIDDGVRSVNKSFRDDIITLFDDAIIEHISLIKNLVRLKGTPNERFASIIDKIFNEN